MPSVLRSGTLAGEGMDTTAPTDGKAAPVSGKDAPAIRRRLGISVAPAVLDVIVVTFTGALVRLIPALTSSFPLHDGGLFLVLIRNIRAAGMALPSVTTYNNAGISFDYPPLAFWVAAALPVDPLTTIRFAGPLAAILMIPALYLVARELLPGRAYAFVAILLYALVPRGWDWLVTGGGLTRTPGMLLALLAIWQFLRLFGSLRWRNAAGAAVFGGLAALTHPEATVFVAMTFGLIAVLKVRDRPALARTIGVAAGVFAVMLPWLLFLAVHGRLADLVRAGGLGFDPLASLVALLTWQFSDEVFVPAVVILGTLGALVLARRSSLLIPLWLLAEVTLATRGAQTYACVPLVLAASVGLYDAIGTGILRIAPEAVLHSNAVRGVLLVALIWTGFNGVGLVYERMVPFDSMPPSAVSTMAWLKANTPPNAQFAVVSGAGWPRDVYGEWLPALTDRVSMATIQGLEWKGPAEWDSRLRKYDELQECAKSDAECVAAWIRAHPVPGPAYAYVVNSDASSALMHSVLRSPSFEVVRSGDDGVVARLIAGS